MKPYFTDITSVHNHQFIPNSSAVTQIPHAQVSLLKTTPAEIPSIETPPTKVVLAPPGLVKHGCEQFKKHLEKVNIATVSDICFLMDKFDVFINKNANAQLAEYTLFGQNEIAGLLEKDVFKVITIEDIPSHIWIFNSYFVDKVKNPGTDKVYERSWLVIQAYNDKKRILY